MTPVEMHLHSYSLRFQFLYRDDFDVFDFIRLASEQGFTGVNISANGPGYRHLGGTSADHFRAVRAALQARGLNAELDTSDTRPAHLIEMLGVADAIGAQQLRVYTRYQGERRWIMAQTVSDLRAIAPVADSLGITVVLENHEDFRGAEIAEILVQVDHPRIRALYDYGNSQMVREDPLMALEAMLPYVTAVHIKDHVLVRDQGMLWVQGIALGQGQLPVMEITRRLVSTGLRRFCFENVWGYAAPMQEIEMAVPELPCFAVSDASGLLRGENLPPADAVSGEFQAFMEGWRWFQQALQSQHITVCNRD